MVKNISNLGDAAVYCDFGSEVNETINSSVIDYFHHISKLIKDKKLKLNTKVITKHLLPNSLTPIIVSSVLGIASAVLIESGLSFLGLGVQAPTASWGNILTDGKEYIQFAWWLSLFPGLAILVTVLGYNLLGEGLRDVLDPKNK